MTDKLTIHQTDLYLLEGSFSVTESTGQVTLELFQTFPQARNPRSQRILSLTLPEPSLSNLNLLVLLARIRLTERKAPDDQ